MSSISTIEPPQQQPHNEEMDVDIQPSELSVCEYISAGAYDATNENRNCIPPNMKLVPEYCPTPLPLEVHATLNYQPKMWTSNCQHCSNYVVDFDGNIFYVSHNEPCLGSSGEGEECFLYKPIPEHLNDIETGIDPVTLNMISSSSRCIAKELNATKHNVKPGQKRSCDDKTCPLAKRRRIEMCNCTTVQEMNVFENRALQSNTQDVAKVHI